MQVSLIHAFVYGISDFSSETADHKENKLNIL
jgi:hypothetical protein